MKNPEFEANPALFGADPETGLVAVESARDGALILYRRAADPGGPPERRTEPPKPFLLLKSRTLLDESGLPCEITPLAGDLAFRFRAAFPDAATLAKARDYLKGLSGNNPADPRAPYLYLADPVHAYLLATGKTLFKGMAFGDLRRLAVDIETYAEPGFSFCNAERETDRVLCIALAGSDGYRRMLSGAAMDEKALLKAFVEAVREHDPDTLEGHNLFKFDLSYLKTRCERHKVKFALGRDGSTAKARTSRVQIAERTIDYPKFEIFGRHVVDTWMLCQMYDVSGRDLPSYGLKEVARHFGLADDDRTIVPPEKIAQTYGRDPGTVERYCLQDAEECLRLSALLSPSHFQQAKIFPYAYQNIVVRGNATKINALMLREYLRAGHSIPEPTEGDPQRGFEGGYTDIFATGVFRDVHHCDVQSLYPSIMTSFAVAPAKDRLGIFLSLLATLRDFRLKTKALMRKAAGAHERDELNALQTAFKVLINSFYGYLGTSRHHFSDLEAASAVTERGRGILRAMVDWLKSRECRILELDTDGIYFQPARPLPDPEGFVGELSATLPAGIEVEYDGGFAAMFSYKKKNYALLDPGGKLTIKGSGLKSRGLERFQRDHMNALIRLLLEGGQAAEADALLRGTLGRIDAGEMPVLDLAKNEVLKDSLDLYRRKVESERGQGGRNRAAAYEIALASGRDYRPGDMVAYYVTGTKKTVKAFENAKSVGDFDPARPDYNGPYYRDKLLKLHETFAGFFEGAAAVIAVTASAGGEAEGQASLFD